MSKAKRVALYLRVSTDDQTIENQRRELTAVAERHGWQIVVEFKDEGISGAKGRDQRPGYDDLCKGIMRKDFDMVASWAVDRLGRSLKELVLFLSDMHYKGVNLYLHQQGLDTSTDMGRMMFHQIALFADFERSLIVSRVKAGLARAKAEPRSKMRLEKLREGKIKQLTFGRPTKMNDAKREKARTMLAENVGVLKIAKQLGVGTGTIQKIKKGMRAAA
jgi:DNA invertase Pin-like site-specific DNA recombinase